MIDINIKDHETEKERKGKERKGNHKKGSVTKMRKLEKIALVGSGLLIQCQNVKTRLK